jgi:hypothetical protein
MRTTFAIFSAACGATFAIVLAGSGCDRKGPTEPSRAATQVTPAPSGSNPDDTHSQTPPDGKKAGPTITVTSEEFYKEYKTDKEATKKKYQDASIIISGTIVQVGADATDRGMISLNAEAQKAYPWVTCLAPGEFEPWARYSPGQTIKLRGQYPTGDVSVPVVIRCTVVEAGPNPAITMTAAKFADELGAGPKAVTEKYEGKYFYVTGEVDAVEKGMNGGATVYLKGNGKDRVPLAFAPVGGTKYEKYKVGSMVKVFAKFDGFNFKNPSLRDCELITK